MFSDGNFALTRDNQSHVLLDLHITVPNMVSFYCSWQRDYYKQGDLSAAVTLVLDFDDIPEILGRRMEWTNSDLDHAIKLLSDSLWKLHFFLDTLVRFR